MADAIDETARQVRSASEVHKLVQAVTDPIVGRRQYKTRCLRYLYNDEGAVLTTHEATCRECNGTARSRRGEAVRADLELVGAAP